MYTVYRVLVVTFVKSLHFLLFELCSRKQRLEKAKGVVLVLLIVHWYLCRAGWGWMRVRYHIIMRKMRHVLMLIPGTIEEVSVSS